MSMLVPRLRLAMIASPGANGLRTPSVEHAGSASKGTGPSGPQRSKSPCSWASVPTRMERTSSTCALPSYIASDRHTVRRIELGLGCSSAATRNPARTSRRIVPVARSPAPRTTTSSPFTKPIVLIAPVRRGYRPQDSLFGEPTSRAGTDVRAADTFALPSDHGGSSPSGLGLLQGGHDLGVVPH